MKKTTMYFLFFFGAVISIWGQKDLTSIIHVWGDMVLHDPSPLTVDQDGNVYLTCTFEDTVFLGTKEDFIVPKDSNDFFISKIHPDGSLAWTKLVTGPGGEFIWDLDVDSNGNVYFTGDFNNALIIDTFFIETTWVNELPWMGESYLCKLSSEGDLLKFRKGAANGEHSDYWRIAVDNVDNLNLFGYSRGSDTVLDHPFVPLEWSVDGHASFLLKSDNNFKADWIIPVGDSIIDQNPNTFVEFNDFATDQYNNLYMVGQAHGEGGGFLLCKVDQDGRMVWSNTTSLPPYSYRYRNNIYVFTDLSNRAYVIGDSYVMSFNDEGDSLWNLALEESEIWNGIVNKDGYTICNYVKDQDPQSGLIIADPGGTIVYDQIFEDMELEQLVMDKAGNVYYKGHFLMEIALESQVINPKKGQNYIIGQLNMHEMISSSHNESSDGNEFLNLYPIPAKNSLTIETHLSAHYKLDIISLNGQLLYSRDIGDHIFQIDLSSFQSGVYFITIRSRDFVTTRKIIRL